MAQPVDWQQQTPLDQQEQTQPNGCQSRQQQAQSAVLPRARLEITIEGAIIDLTDEQGHGMAVHQDQFGGLPVARAQPRVGPGGVQIGEECRQIARHAPCAVPGVPGIRIRCVGCGAGLGFRLQQVGEALELRLDLGLGLGVRGQQMAKEHRAQLGVRNGQGLAQRQVLLGAGLLLVGGEKDAEQPEGDQRGPQNEQADPGAQGHGGGVMVTDPGRSRTRLEGSIKARKSGIG